MYSAKKIPTVGAASRDVKGPPDPKKLQPSFSL